MKFIDRENELERLDRLARRRAGGLAVVYGRRRIGKTRLLLEWARKHDGLYTVADQSSADIQRRYFGQAVAGRLPGFADVEYPDWQTLLARLAHEARSARWRGPIIFDEVPNLVASHPPLPSILQHWLDQQASEARLSVALAGSSQRMMQGLVLAADAPLYGRAREILDIGPLDPSYLREAVPVSSGRALVEAYTAWGGVPRYWELAAGQSGRTTTRVEQLVLDPLGPLHREPDRLLIEESPSAMEVRPVLDAIGAGAHRVSEIAARIGRPATSMSRALDRLVGMGIARREIPFGEHERKSRRALYKIDDPFHRLWFRVVAPHRADLAAGTRGSRSLLLRRYWNDLAGHAWEDLCRLRLSRLGADSAMGRLGPWGPARRWWRGAAPEWDIVSESMDGKHLLLGEAKGRLAAPMGAGALQRAARDLARKPPPNLPARFDRHSPIRALFVPEVEPGVPVEIEGVAVMSADLLC